MKSPSQITNQSPLAVLTPYSIPDEMRDRKVVNIGDGFILRAIENLIGEFSSTKTFSPRIAPSPEALRIMENSPATILAGANQLNDNYSVWPGLTGAVIRAKKLRLIPFGVGVHGEAGKNISLSESTKDVLLAMHEQIEHSSWRCPITVDFLRRELPQIGDQFLLTGCPVIYGQPLLNGTQFNTRSQRIAVTVTERHNFWQRETEIIDTVARRFPRSKRFLVLHQNYSPPTRFEYFRHRWLTPDPPQENDYARLRWYAVKRGFRIVTPNNIDDCIDFYDHIDIHFGSRLHAHLLCLSRAKRSGLIAVDGRAEGIAQMMGFPLYNPSEIDKAIEFDFNIVREHAIACYATMQRFLESLPR